MEPEKLTPEEALQLISNNDIVMAFKNEIGKISSERLNRADINVIVSHENMFLDPRPERSKYKVFYIDAEGCRVYLETKQEDV